MTSKTNTTNRKAWILMRGYRTRDNDWNYAPEKVTVNKKVMESWKAQNKQDDEIKEVVLE